MREMIRELVSRRELLYMLARRDISIKYKQSVMGFLWAILMPSLVIVAGILVRVGLSRVGAQPLTAAAIGTVAVKALPWSFFIASLRFATASLTVNGELVTKVSLPRAVFPLAAVLSQCFDFAVASVLLVVVLGFLGIGAGVHLAWVPLLLGILLVLVVALGVLLAAGNLFFRDVKYLVEVFITFAIFFTPVFYETTMFGRWGRVLLLNPVAPVLEGLAAAVVRGVAPSAAWTLYSAVVALALLAVALHVFRRLEPAFAESI
jgi:homopolymeric O-antigen transport system permease protein